MALPVKGAWGWVMANECKAVQVAEVCVERGIVTWDCSG